MFKKTRLCLAIGAAFGAGMVGLAPAALAQTQQLERVEITGSAIKRTQQEADRPVEIYTKEEIARTGATNINELIRSIPSVDIFDQGELASNSPAGSGTANVRLRGLSSSNVLVLLNGRRLPVNALYDSSGAGAAVDINTIPVGAIERIEILKDGASAIYGADAVAGVFNIITRKDYQGIEARAGYGVTSYGDGDEVTAGITGGWGDLNKDRFNILVGIDYFKRDPILRKDRDISRSVDFRRFGAGDRRSSFAPQGNVLTSDENNFSGVTYRPCPPENFNGVCRYDFNQSLLTAYNGAERWSGMATATFQINPDIRAFAEVMYSKSDDHFDAHPVPDFFYVPVTPATAAQESIFAPGSVAIAGRFMQGGPRMTDREASLLSFAAGLEGRSFNLDWKFNVGQGISKVTNNDSNYYNANLWVPATSSGALDPTVNTNDPALVQSLKVYPTREGESTITYANAQVGGEMFNLPGGPMAWAFGLQWYRDELKDTPDALTQAGDVVGSIQQAAVSADRNSYAAFLEVLAPVWRTVELRGAVRYDHYPQESQVSPMFGIRWQAHPNVVVRGTWTNSFRAPVLKQLYGAQEEGAITITDPNQCAALGVPLIGGQCLVNAFQVNGANPDLTAETAETYNLGIVLDAGPASISVDWWRILKEDVISSPTVNSAIQNGNFTFGGAPARYRIFTNLQNIAETATSGIDVDARIRIPGTGIGTLTLRNLLTYYYDVSTRSSAGDDWAQFLDTYPNNGLPRWRNVFVADLETGPWAFRGMYRSVAGFEDTDLPAAEIPPGTRDVSPYGELDLQAMYSGFKNLTLTAGVKNVTNRQPPFSFTNASDNAYTQMGFAELYTNRGRFLYANVAYKFR